MQVAKSSVMETMSREKTLGRMWRNTIVLSLMPMAFAAVTYSISRCASTKFYIPCITQGGPGSLYPGTYAGLWDAIDEYNCKTFGFTKAQLEEQRPPMAILF